MNKTPRWWFVTCNFWCQGPITKMGASANLFFFSPKYPTWCLFFLQWSNKDLVFIICKLFHSKLIVYVHIRKKGWMIPTPFLQSFWRKEEHNAKGSKHKQKVFRHTILLVLIICHFYVLKRAIVKTVLCSHWNKLLTVS